MGNSSVWNEKDILETEESADAQALAQWFKEDNIVLYGLEGTGVLGGTEPGVQIFDLEILSHNPYNSILFWDGEKAQSLFSDDWQWNNNQSVHSFAVETVSDEWGFLLMKGHSNTDGSNSKIAISNVQWVPNFNGQLTQLYAPKETELINENPISSEATTFVEDGMGNWKTWNAKNILETKDSADSQVLAYWLNEQDIYLY